MPAARIVPSGNQKLKKANLSTFTQDEVRIHQSWAKPARPPCRLRAGGKKKNYIAHQAGETRSSHGRIPYRPSGRGGPHPPPPSTVALLNNLPPLGLFSPNATQKQIFPTNQSRGTNPSPRPIASSAHLPPFSRQIARANLTYPAGGLLAAAPAAPAAPPPGMAPRERHRLPRLTQIRLTRALPHAEAVSNGESHFQRPTLGQKR
ncbi:uncharacterized protein VTP21DRAFT_6141 [Calcarisporiella thermophila]|uniref:uncharacterized protein n=1 Tax=Calcarisporiella thermophila TaxID=911321 RepID=UPI0037432196